MTQGEIAGKDIFLYIGNILVGCAMEASINIDVEMLEAACKGFNSWKKVKPGQKSWSISLRGIYRLYDATESLTNFGVVDLFDAIVGDEMLTIKFGTAVTGDTQFTGDVYLNNWAVEASAEDWGYYSAAATGTDEVTKIAVAA